MKNKILIKSGRLLDPANKLDKKADLLLEQGKIKEIGKDLEATGAEIIDARGLLVVPGFIDLHTHLRDPGRLDEETIESGCLAAAHGGFTDIFVMPNTDPVADRASVIEYIKERSDSDWLICVHPVGSNSKEGLGKELAEMAEMSYIYTSTYAEAFSNDGLVSGDSGMLRRTLQYAKMLNVPIFWHCDDISLSAGGQMNESVWSTKLGLRGFPAIAEEIALRELVEVASYEGAKVHAQHISTAGSVEIIRQAKDKGVDITAEVCPHHILFTEEDLAGYDTSYKMNPPLRSRADVEALIGGLKDGTIDAIATDHAPHARHEKEQEFENAPFGITGLETCFPSLYTHLRDDLGLELIVEKLTAGPIKVMGWEKSESNGLMKGHLSNIVIIDLNEEFECSADWFQSKSLNTPFLGKRLRGSVKYIFHYPLSVRGEILMKNGQMKGLAPNKLSWAGSS